MNLVPCSAILLLCSAAALLPGCKPRVAAITGTFVDSFDRATLGSDWNNTSKDSAYRIVAGKLNVARAHNHPAWLLRRLPENVEVSVDVMSRSADGDIKVEIFGDGHSFDDDMNRYEEASGYSFIFGGWHNQLSVISRMGEHDNNVKAQRSEPKVAPGRVYHWTITRKGGQLEWRIDGQPFLAWTDPDPLHGDGHEFLCINNWEADVLYDNLTIKPAP